jgi:predicted DNA-binding protein (MmcQ/YjbR family)
MDRDSIREFCLSLPHATEGIQWGSDLLFRIGNKIFAVVCLEPTERPLTFKCSPETFVELCERDGIAPAAYVGRYNFVSAQLDSIPPSELRALLRSSYDLVHAGLPAKLRAKLGGEDSAKPVRKAAKRKRAVRSRAGTRRQKR